MGGGGSEMAGERGGGQMPIIVHFPSEHFLGTEQLIPVASFHCFSFRGLIHSEVVGVFSSSPSCYLCGVVFHIVECIWMDSM